MMDFPGSGNQEIVREGMEMFGNRARLNEDLRFDR